MKSLNEHLAEGTAGKAASFYTQLGSSHAEGDREKASQEEIHKHLGHSIGAEHYAAYNSGYDDSKKVDEALCESLLKESTGDHIAITEYKTGGSLKKNHFDSIAKKHGVVTQSASQRPRDKYKMHVATFKEPAHAAAFKKEVHATYGSHENFHSTKTPTHRVELGHPLFKDVLRGPLHESDSTLRGEGNIKTHSLVTRFNTSTNKMHEKLSHAHFDAVAKEHGALHTADVTEMPHQPDHLAQFATKAHRDSYREAIHKKFGNHPNFEATAKIKGPDAEFHDVRSGK